MEIIKFKAIDQFSDGWIYAPAFFIDKDNNQGYLAWGIDHHHCVKKETVCQFTGIKDKLKNEIFQGDITDALEVVIFSNGSFRTTHKDDQTGGGLLTKRRANYIKIIGNIHTHHELLK